ncbi:MAG: hypothetical protein N4A33_03640 [Bacteriovoracaceae bacterium]|jgi:hypothetical protein|nr:hypothetical protein [Bacteriovoracaceae bacterium]
MKQSLFILFCLILTSCVQQEPVETTEQVIISDQHGNNSSGGSSSGSSGETGSGNNSSTTAGTGVSCTGVASNDGQGSGYPMHQFEMLLAGHQSWLPGTYSSSLASSTMPTILQAGLLFPTDSRLRVRMMVKSQPYPTAGQEYCYGRQVGQASDAHPYTKLKYRVHLRDVHCSTYNGNGQCTNAYLGSRYATQYVDPIDVGSCSPILDFGHLRNTGGNIIATTIEVDDVKADSTCQYNSTYCPAEKVVRAASCWHMKLQVVTDYTQDFK